MRDESRARVLVIALLLVSASLIMLDIRGSAAVGGLRALTGSIVGPIESAIAAAASPFVSMAQSVTSFGAVDERERIATEELQRVAGTSQEDKAVSESLEKVLKTAGVGGYSVIPARVVAYGSTQNFGGSITIDAGSLDQIETDMSVISGDGLVGRVVQVTPTTSTVELITDSKSVVAARIEGSRQAGALSGTGSSNRMSLKLLDPTVSLKEGDKVVSFGSPDGRPYAPGLALGAIVGFQGEQGQADRIAFVQPAAAMSALDVVGVIVQQSRTEPRDLQKPSPSPSSTPTETPN
ncbi:MAG: rod shape-determining protein MreC [Candidatus Nanopelagicales bacterium]